MLSTIYRLPQVFYVWFYHLVQVCKIQGFRKQCQLTQFSQGFAYFWQMCCTNKNPHISMTCLGSFEVSMSFALSSSSSSSVLEEWRMEVVKTNVSHQVILPNMSCQIFCFEFKVHWDAVGISDKFASQLKVVWIINNTDVVRAWYYICILVISNWLCQIEKSTW